MDCRPFWEPCVSNCRTRIRTSWLKSWWRRTTHWLRFERLSTRGCMRFSDCYPPNHDPELICGSLHPQGHSFGKWKFWGLILFRWVHKGGAFLMELVLLSEKTQGSLFSIFLCPVKTKRLPSSSQEEGSHQNPSMLTLTLDFAAFWTVRNKLLSLRRLSDVHMTSWAGYNNDQMTYLKYQEGSSSSTTMGFQMEGTTMGVMPTFLGHLAFNMGLHRGYWWPSNVFYKLRDPRICSWPRFVLLPGLNHSPSSSHWKDYDFIIIIFKAESQVHSSMKSFVKVVPRW